MTLRQLVGLSIWRENEILECTLDIKINYSWIDYFLKIHLSSTDMILHRENPKDSTKTLLELKNEFSKVIGYNINVQKPVAFLSIYQ